MWVVVLLLVLVVLLVLLVLLVLVGTLANPTTDAQSPPFSFLLPPGTAPIPRAIPIRSCGPLANAKKPWRGKCGTCVASWAAPRKCGSWTLPPRNGPTSTWMIFGSVGSPTAAKIGTKRGGNTTRVISVGVAKANAGCTKARTREQRTCTGGATNNSTSTR